MRYFVGFLLTMGLIILLVILLFRGGGKPKVPTTSKTLVSYATTDAEVSMTIDGPVNANSLHQQLRITVDHNNVTFETLKGYEGSVTQMKRFDNNTSAYDNFLHALSRAGYTLGDSSKALADERGVCPLGSRYIFKLTQGAEDIERFWATTCGTKTYKGVVDTTIQLFQNQVPNYSELASDFIAAT